MISRILQSASATPKGMGSWSRYPSLPISPLLIADDAPLWFSNAPLVQTVPVLARSEACVRGALRAYAHALGAFDQRQACCGYQADRPALLRCEIRRPPGC